MTLTTTTERRYFDHEKDVVARELEDGPLEKRDYDDQRRELEDNLFGYYDYSDRRRELKESDKDNLPGLSHVFRDHAISR